MLPSHLASNPELRQRFEREARAVSSLNHPHICTLHDIGHQDGTDGKAMIAICGGQDNLSRCVVLGGSLDGAPRVRSRNPAG